MEDKKNFFRKHNCFFDAYLIHTRTYSRGANYPSLQGDISEGDRGGVVHYVRWAPTCRRKKAWYVLKHFYEGIGGTQ